MTRAGVLKDLPSEAPFSGITRRALSTDQATIQEYRFEPGAKFPMHEHAQEQITLILEGSVAFTAGAETQRLDPGSWAVVPGGVAHGITAGPSGTRFLAILVPARLRGESYTLTSEPHPQERSL
jgi:quercetin dioxygenase-like cupin family protein